MDADYIHRQILHMRPSSFSAKEQQCYRAEKMLMRQFVLMKLHRQVPSHICVEDMKNWLLDGRSFLEEFQEKTKEAGARQLLAAELAWTAARRLCVNQMEHELWEELEKEKRLSLLLGRKVTLEGLQMFLSVLRPKAEQDVRVLLRHLSNKLLNSFTGSLTSNTSKRGLLAKLQRTTLTLAPQVVETVLLSLLDEPEPLVEAWTTKTQGQRFGAECACAHAGKQLAEAAATCFCLNTAFTKALLLQTCVSAALNMVKTVHKRFTDSSKTFHLLDFDESFFTARESVVQAIQGMDDKVRGAAYSLVLQQLVGKKAMMTRRQKGEARSESLPLANVLKDDVCVH